MKPPAIDAHIEPPETLAITAGQAVDLHRERAGSAVVTVCFGMPLAFGISTLLLAIAYIHHSTWIESALILTAAVIFVSPPLLREVHLAHRNPTGLNLLTVSAATYIWAGFSSLGNVSMRRPDAERAWFMASHAVTEWLWIYAALLLISECLRIWLLGYLPQPHAPCADVDMPPDPHQAHV